MAAEAERQAFLIRQGWTGRGLVPLLGDASARRYYRLHETGRPPCLLAETPHPESDIVRFCDLAARLARHGFSVPTIYGADPEHGLLLLEDFGDATICRIQEASPARSADLDCLMVDLLVALHQRIGAESLIGCPRYDPALFTTQAGLFLETAFPLVQGHPPSPEAAAGFAAAWLPVLENALAPVPCGFLHRDFHGGNLVLISGRSGIANIGILDFQDAGCGPVLYDLVSLAEDARRTLAPDHCQKLILRYRTAFPEFTDPAFQTAFSVLAAQRHTRIIAVFTRLSHTAGRHDYARHLPRVIAALHHHLTAPALAPVAAWFTRYFPPDAFSRLLAHLSSGRLSP